MDPSLSTRRIGLVTDSNAQLPAGLVVRLAASVVPIAIVIDDEVHLESDLDTDDFYQRLAEGARVTTSQPSPGEFVEAYSRLESEGVDAIVSIHVGANLSGTVNSAFLAAREVSVPVEVVDTGQTSFSVGLAVWAAADVIDRGCDLSAVRAAAEAAAKDVANVFVIEALTLARRSGRVTVNDRTGGGDEDIPVVALRGTDLDVVGYAGDVAGACRVMADVVADEPGPLRVGIGVGGRSAFGFYDELEAQLEGLRNVSEVIRYRCGPSVGAFSGPEIAGMAWAPLSVTGIGQPYSEASSSSPSKNPR